MTTRGPDSEPYPGYGQEADPYAATEEREWRYQPPVPSWSAGQYAGPVYDDTGWQLDLSNVDWGTDPRRDRPGDPAADAGTAFRYENDQEGNGVRPAYRRSDRPVEEPASRPERPTRRHARHARTGDQPYPTRQRPAPGSGRPAGSRPSRSRPDSYEPGPPDSYRQGPDAYRQGAPDGYRPGSPEAYQPGPQDGYRQRSPEGYRPGPPDGYRQGSPEGYRPGQPDSYRPGAPPGYQRGAPPPTGYRPGPPPAGYRPGPPGSYRPGPPGAYPPGPPPASYRQARARAARQDGGSASIVRSSSVMAAGTLGSRLTGFLRTIAQSYALGLGGVALAYNLSNTLPNVVYNLALGGILTSVIVPLIVNASRRDADHGEGYDQRMFTLVTVALLAVTVVATIGAVPIVHLYSGTSVTHSRTTLHLAVIFALFFIPQIFFYGVSSLIGAILNSRGSFAAPMWTPIINNFVVIAVLVLYVQVAGLHRTPGTISGTEVQLLGLGTTLGIVAQTIALIPALRRVGFRWQPRTDFRRSEVAEIGRMAGWMFGYIAATQVAFLVTTKVAGDANTQGVTDYNYAWLLFQLPYAVVGVSVITALLPRMSAHASEGRLRLVREDFSAGVRLASTIVVPCSLVLAVLGPRLGQVFFGHGATHPAGAHYIGVVFAVFCLGLLPYMIFQLQLRVFYSLHDSKTPALIGLATMIMNIVANLIALYALPKSQIVAGLGVGFGLANMLGMVISWRILGRRLHGLDGWRICRSLVRMHAATLPAALIAFLVTLITTSAIVTVIVGGGLALAMYFMFARALRIDELGSVSRTMMARFGR